MTRNYFINCFKTFSILPLYGGLTASKNLSNLKLTSLYYARVFEKFLKPSKDLYLPIPDGPTPPKDKSFCCK